MKIYFDESGQTGCVLQKDDLLNFREQPVFALGAITIDDEKEEEILIAKYKAFKQKYGIAGEIKGSDLLTRSRNNELKYFIKHLLDNSHYQVILYDKKFYLSTLMLLCMVGFEYQASMPVHFYQQADYLAKQNDEFFVNYLKYIEEPSMESFKEYLYFLINFNYTGEDIAENAMKIMAQRIVDEKIEEKCFDDFMTYGWYDDSKITNLINLNALSELIYSIKDRYMAFNENITYIHDDIREYEATIKNELGNHNINIVFQDSKTSEMLQIVDNFVSIIRHAYDKMIMHIRDKDQWGISSEWDMKLAANLFNVVSISNIIFTVPMCDWAAAICTEKMFSIDYPKYQRNNMFFNGYYIDALMHIQTSLEDINHGLIMSVFDTLDR